MLNPDYFSLIHVAAFDSFFKFHAESSTVPGTISRLALQGVTFTKSRK